MSRLVFVPADPPGGEHLDADQAVQWAASKRCVITDCFVLVEPDGGLGQGVVVGIAN